jgi:HD-like signal output (HDOD) protein
MPTAVAEPKDPQVLVREAIKRVTALATLPEVTAKIISTVEDPRSSAGTLHKIISHDPALVTRIMKVVNSAFYGLPGQIGSVERAIVLLGLNAVKNLAVAASLGQLFRGLKLCDGFVAKDLWTHCIGVGVTARELARAAKLPYADEAFLAGMIHDIGIVVELQSWPEQLQEVCGKVQKQGGEFCASEQEILGLNHQLLGQALAEQWKFPKVCQHVAGFHHHPADAPEESRGMVWLIQAADTLCCQSNIGFNLTALHQHLDTAGLSEIGIDATHLEPFATGDLKARIATAVQLLS